jgi:hypothetical protein
MEGENDETNDITGLMNAMDQELESSHSTSRALDQQDGVQASSDEVTRNLHILSNLLQSLDVAGGSAGPIRNILREMGIEPPNLLPDDQGEER